MTHDPKETGSVRDECRKKLRAWRKETADALNVPAYLVFSNRVLDAIVDAWPRTRDELAAVKGVGPAKMEQHGDAVLALLGGFPHPPPIPAPTRLGIDLKGGLWEDVREAAESERRSPEDLARTALRHYLVARRHFLEEGYAYRGGRRGASPVVEDVVLGV